MSYSPLYDNLEKECKNQDLTLEEKQEFLNMVNTVDNEAHEKMFLLIRHHGLKSSSRNIFNIPYEGKEEEGDIKFNLEKLPLLLKQILFRFLKIHISSLDSYKN